MDSTYAPIEYFMLFNELHLEQNIYALHCNFYGETDVSLCV